MKLSDFDYDLPESLIAQFPLKQRDEARLLIVNRQQQTIRHDQFKNLLNYIPQTSHFVFNNTKVVPARLLGRREQGTAEVEIFLLKKCDDVLYEVLMRPQKRLNEGEKIYFADDFYAEIVSKENRQVRFNQKNVSEFLNQYGHMPLPPYIQRQDNQEDKQDYQTLFAQREGSVAAPTAGLHFSEKILNDIKRKYAQDEVTLHINYGTFQPVTEENICDHQMHTEFYEMGQQSFDHIQTSKQKGASLIAVGTTSCRTLETVAQSAQLSGETKLFIYPGYSFKLVDHLITNFHLPRSTLLMLVYAFGGMDLMKQAYKEAIKQKYRFYSYGDGMLIL